jgi:predicted S18 family serine protease
MKSDTAQSKMQTSGTETKSTASINEIVAGYLNVKNALASDNGKEAATAGKEIVNAMNKLDKASLTAEQKKVYEDVEDDAKEHAQHISTNADKIDHQREHFDMLSQDMYDLVKTFGAGQTLYKDFCPMYNNNKGAAWLSETKEIKNPYLGKKMSDCGSIKEEIK